MPLGSVEQHGHHLPLDTDSAIAAHLAEALCALARDRQESFSATIVDLVRRGLGSVATGREVIRLENGFPVTPGGRVTTEEDVRALDNEQ